jgi:hypothetical protein
MTSYSDYDKLAAECYKQMAKENDPVRLQKLNDQFINYVNMSRSLKSPALFQQQANEKMIVSSGYGIYSSGQSNPYQTGFCGSAPTNIVGYCSGSHSYW